MEINNQTISSLQNKILVKYEKLNKIDTQENNKKISKIDYFSISNNYEKNDYERVLEKFKSLDSNVRIHEQSHASLMQTNSAISYTYHKGPDGKFYINGGSVQVDTYIPKDPKEALLKLDKISQGSTAANHLSAADANISNTANLNKILILNKINEKNSQVF